MKPKITGYSFGRMTVAGQEFTSDLIIFPDGRIMGNWWRTRGHTLIPEDIASILKTAPGRLIIGTGLNGMMRVEESVIEQCKKHNIEVEACPTAIAVELFNQEEDVDISTAACFHLTC